MIDVISNEAMWIEDQSAETIEWLKSWNVQVWLTLRHSTWPSRGQCAFYCLDIKFLSPVLSSPISPNVQPSDNRLKSNQMR